MAFDLFPWNDWIDLVIEGNAEPFMKGLTRTVAGNTFFKGKSSTEICVEYGVDLTDTVQTVALELLDKKVLDDFKKRQLTDQEIAIEITVRVRSRIVDAFRKRRRETETFVDMSNDFGEGTKGSSSQENELLIKETIELILDKLGPGRRSLVFRHYKKFYIGELEGPALANVLGVSIQTINKDVREIKDVIRSVAEEMRYSRNAEVVRKRSSARQT